MSYEKSPVADSSTAIPAMPPPQMREDREINPYQHVSRLDKVKNTVLNGQQNTVSDPVEPGKTEETVTLSPHMAALARKEQRFRQQEQAVKAREAALEAKSAKIAKLEALESKIATGDFSDLEELVGYDKYTQWKIDQSSSVSPEQQALKEVKAELDNVKKNIQDDVSRRYEAAVNDRRNAVNALVDTNPEYSGIKKMKMQEAVVQHILDTWEHDNTELTPEQAAKEVKEALKEKATSWASFLEETPAPAEEKKQLPPLKQGMKTLTNQLTTGTELKRPVKSFQGMSDAERYAEARRRAEEKLKGK